MKSTATLRCVNHNNDFIHVPIIGSLCRLNSNAASWPTAQPELDHTNLNIWNLYTTHENTPGLLQDLHTSELKSRYRASKSEQALVPSLRDRSDPNDSTSMGPIK